MRNFCIYIIFLVALMSCRDNSFSILKISGKITNTSNKKISLVSFSDSNNTIVLDTSRILLSGKFELATAFKKDELLAIQVENETPIWLVADEEEITVDIDFNNYKKYKTKGSTASEAVHQFLNKTDLFLQEQQTKTIALDSLRKIKSSDSIVNVFKESIKSNDNSFKNYSNKLIASTKNPALKYFYLFYVLKLNIFDENQVFKMVANACDTFPQHTQLLGLKNNLRAIVKSNPKLFLVNTTAADFNALDSVNNIFSLNSIKNKYLLIDFWSINSKTNQQEFNALKTTYKDYQLKQFDVLRVALNTNRKEWMSVIKKDTIGWKNYIDSNALQSEVAKKYYITTLPYNVLINPNKKIIAVDIKGEALRDKLKKLLP